jgi:hypothetical protein
MRIRGSKMQAKVRYFSKVKFLKIKLLKVNFRTIKSFFKLFKKLLFNLKAKISF